MVSIYEKINNVEKKFLKTNLPDFGVGDTIKMKIKVHEADKVRLHPFEGIVISRKGQGLRSTFTVRKMSFGEGVEKTFPLHSPTIDSIEIVSKGKVNRARLYYLRGRVGKKTKVKLGHGPEAAAPAATSAPAA